MPPPPAPTSALDPSARAMAIAAASSAALNAAPGQRDRAIEEAAKAALSKQQQHQKDGSEPASLASQARPLAPYEPPEWGGPPLGVPFSIETLRDGTLLENRPLSQEGDLSKGHYTFGRSPDSDFILEHPSASRFHAVVQFNSSSREAFLYDQGSTHGTFLNKGQIKPHMHVPLPVGSTFKLGQSTRIYILNGPQELMPEEGLNRAQRKQLATMEHARLMMEKDKRTAQAQMQAAIGGGGDGGASWGMRDDAIDPSFDLEDVDWRSYGQLNDRQRKLSEKVRSKEYLISNMRIEIERIQAKEKLEAGLTPGQASTIARNETSIAKMTEEISELEDLLNESVRQAMRDKAKERGEEVEEEGAKGKRKRPKGMNEEDLVYLQASDDEDEFFDRTKSRKVRSAADRGGGGNGGGGKQVVEVVSAASLYGEREALLDERKRIEVSIIAQSAAQETKPASDHKVEASPSAVASSGSSQEKDALDEYLMNMKEDAHALKMKGLRRDLVEIEARLERVKRLLKIADPDGWMSSQSSKAVAAKSLAAKALQRSIKPEPAAIAASKLETFVEEMEEDEEEEKPEPVPAIAPQPLVAPVVDFVKEKGSLVIRKPQNHPTAPTAEASKQIHPKPSNPEVTAAAKLLMAEMSGKDTTRGASKPQQRQLPELGSNRKALVADMAADAKASEYIALMERREREIKEIEEEAAWVPPANQDGSGRSALNEKFNY